MNTVPVAVRDRAIAKSKPWVPPAEAQQKLPATVDDRPVVVVPDDEDQPVVVPPKRKKQHKKHQGGELTTETLQAGGQTTINIIN